MNNILKTKIYSSLVFLLSITTISNQATNPLRKLTSSLGKKPEQKDMVTSQPNNTSVDQNKKAIFCHICYDAKTDFSKLPCGHAFCNPCLKENKEYQLKNNLPLSCPNPSCMQKSSQLKEKESEQSAYIVEEAYPAASINGKDVALFTIQFKEPKSKEFYKEFVQSLRSSKAVDQIYVKNDNGKKMFRIQTTLTKQTLNGILKTIK